MNDDGDVGFQFGYRFTGGMTDISSIERVESIAEGMAAYP
jgi:hypothetical protein